jgi:HEAT repeat protein
VPAGLISLLSSESDDARLKAAWALGEVGDSTVISAVQSALGRETSDRIRSALTRALIRSGGRSRATLEQLLESKDPKTREAAIRGLTGRDAMNPWPWPWPRPRPFP